MKRFIFLVAILTGLMFSGCSQPNPVIKKEIGGRCEDCEQMFEGMPGNLAWRTVIAGADEPGEPLVISGTIYKSDGKTPASNVILYVYQTDNTGNYTPGPQQTRAKQHGHLRGWMKTDENGRYEFKTIRPAAYPGRKDPQHIHPIIYEPGKGYYWIDDFVFTDDPLLTEQQKAQQEKADLEALNKDLEAQAPTTSKKGGKKSR